MTRRLETVGTTPKQQHPSIATNRIQHGRDLPEAWLPPESNKASLSVFQRCEVKVLGFGVKARPRPQRMALRWLHVPFALVGANGKACGEAPGVSVSGTPPLSGGGGASP